MHYYQFNISDYKSHTEHLEPLEDLAYRRMLDWCYLHEKPLPKNKDEIARMIRMRSHSDCIAIVLREFFTKKESGEYIHKRVFIEITKANEKSSKARESAKARWDKVSSNANALQTDSEGNATQDTRHTTQDTLPKRATSKIASRFDDFWKTYPKKKEKKKTLEIWKRRKLDNIADKLISDITIRMKSDKNWIDGFIPNPTTYLNGDRWEDEIKGDSKTEALDPYSHFRKIGAEKGIHPNGSESNKDYIERVKANV